MKKFNELQVGDKITWFLGTRDRRELVITDIIEKSENIILSYGPGEYQKECISNPNGYFSVNYKYSCPEVIIPSENRRLIELYEVGFNNGTRTIQNKLQTLIGIEL